MENRILAVIVVIVLLCGVALGLVAYSERMDECYYFAEMNPSYQIKYDKVLGCAIKIGDLWVSARSLMEGK